jgi:hypothetical protein
MKTIFIGILVLVACVGNSNGQTKLYFPLAKSHGDAKNADSKLDTLEENWYSGQLAAMNEPVLYNDSSKNTIYRFIWLRSRRHPVVIRIERRRMDYMLYWKECEGPAGYGMDKLIVDKKKKIDKAIWKEFEDKIVQMHFDTMRTNIDVFGLDGAEWVLEGKWGKRYHLVNRWTIGGTKDFYTGCLFLLHLTDIDAEKKVY